MIEHRRPRAVRTGALGAPCCCRLMEASWPSAVLQTPPTFLLIYEDTTVVQSEVRGNVLPLARRDSGVYVLSRCL